MNIRFQLGDRVRISEDHHWAKGVTGTITEPPAQVQKLARNDAPWEGWQRRIVGLDRLIEFYWVKFDEPQIDADGDGPYDGAEIEAQMIEVVSRSA